MYFEADMNDEKYQINIIEKKTHWQIELKTEEGNWEQLEISKHDFKQLDDNISLIFDNKSYLLDYLNTDNEYTVFTRGSYRDINIYNEETLLHQSLKHGSVGGAANSLTSGMPGKIIKVLVKEGDQVEKDTPILIMEAMKMENEMRAQNDCKIAKIHVGPGDTIEANALLISYE